MADPRWRRLAWVAVAWLGVPVSAAAQGESDPWAPGASREPWPLISTIQSWASFDPDARGVDAALAHHDPLVRTAACWAVGRVRPAGANRLLAALITDPDTRVRDAALWAALRLDDAASLPLVARALAARRRLAVPGSLFERRGIPAAVAARGAEFRRDWLADVDLAQSGAVEEAFL